MFSFFLIFPKGKEILKQKYIFLQNYWLLKWLKDNIWLHSLPFLSAPHLSFLDPELYHKHSTEHSKNKTKKRKIAKESYEKVEGAYM